MQSKITTNTNLVVFNRDKHMKTMVELVPIYAKHSLKILDLNFCEMMNPTSALLNVDSTKEYLKELKQYKSELGVEYFQCHLPYPMRGEDPWNIEKLKLALSYCDYLEIPLAVVHPIIGSIEDNIHYFETLKPYIPNGVTLSIENMETKEELHTIEELNQLLDNLSFKAGICLDTGHANIVGEDIPTFIEKAGYRLLSTHINDNDGTKDQHMLPGFGKIKWEEIIPTFKRYYNGYLNYEAMFFTRGCSESVENEVIDLAKAIGSWLLGL